MAAPYSSQEGVSIYAPLIQKSLRKVKFGFFTLVNMHETHIKLGAKSARGSNEKSQVAPPAGSPWAAPGMENITCITYNYVKLVGGMGFEPITFHI